MKQSLVAIWSSRVMYAVTNPFELNQIAENLQSSRAFELEDKEIENRERKIEFEALD